MATTQGSEDGSHLFLVRVWMDAGLQAGVAGREEPASLPPDSNSCHGRVQHVISGEAVSFVDWNTLADAIRGMAGNPDVSRTKPP